MTEKPEMFQHVSFFEIRPGIQQHKMAVIGSMFFNRTLRQFLDCPDLTSKKGKDLIKKIRQSAKNSLEKILEVLPRAQKQHKEILTEICLEHAKGKMKEAFLDILEHDTTNIRSAAADILSQSSQINPSRLFKRLQETDVSKTEIIDILDFQKEVLRPEQIINNALKLDKGSAERLLKIAAEMDRKLDLDDLIIEPELIESPDIKFMLLRYFGQLKQPEISTIISKFLIDKNKTVVIAALKSLIAMPAKFDASVVLPFIDTMSDIEREMALEIVSKQANPELVPRLAPWTTGKSDEIREIFAKIVVKHATSEGLEKFLKRLDQQDWWGQEQAIKCLMKLGNDRFFQTAKELVNHKDDFISGSAQQLAALQSDPADITMFSETVLHHNWQVREKAIASIGAEGNRDALGLLKLVIEKRPESAIAVLKAVNKVGLAKGLEISVKCLGMTEAMVQREALESIALLANEKHAEKVRGMVLKSVPNLQATVRDTAEQVINKLTSDFGLSKLQLDKDLFETRLVKIDQARAESKKQAASVSAEATEVVIFQNIEELKEGDLWMDRFRIKGEIGRGAMGRVMLAEDEMVGDPLILKFMHPELTVDGASRERFLREVKYSRMVSHQNVIRIHDMLFKDNLCAISMEYFESRGIDELLKQKKSFEVREGLEILYQVCEGMAAAHKQDVIHRDLKPSNILMDDTGLVKIVDFGIASASTNTESTLTKTGSIIGTPAYISPERAKGLDADERCDIYALGVIAYYMFTGTLPYKGEPMAILFQHLEGNAKPAHEVKESINPLASQLVQKMMAVEAKDRIQTMEQARDEIKTTLDKI
ncbi:MAG: protein kinase [Gammaproteobacteria bacterium]